MAMALKGALRLFPLLLSVAVVVVAAEGEEIISWMKTENLGYRVLSHALTNSPSSGGSCSEALQSLMDQVEANDLKALKVLDAWGKFPSGFLFGQNVDMGNYESCLAVTTTTKYCLSTVDFVDQQKVTVRIGTCLPMECSANQLGEWITNYLSPSIAHAAVEEKNCATATQLMLSPLDWIAIAICASLGTVIILATFMDVAKLQSPLLNAFSLRSNLEQWLQVTLPESSSSQVIHCLHGIRCLTIGWIVLGHGYMFLRLAPSINASMISVWTQTPYSMLVQNFSIAVDTFFVLSGLLVAMSTLRQLDRQHGKLNVPKMYLHRVLRLTPVLALAVLLFMTLVPRLGNGPLWDSFISSYQLCESTWWATLLYVQNYAAPGRMCLGHSWYLAVDMQLFVLSPLLLLPLWRWRHKAAAAIVILILLLYGCVFSIVMLNDLVTFKSDGNLGEDNEEMRKIYYTTHARATPWLLGLLFGYFLHCERGRQRRLRRWLVLLMWLVTLAMLAMVIFAVYPFTQADVADITPLAGAFYLCSIRIAWPLALCWLIWACQNGYGGLIDMFLSWTFWQPVSKLSYCMYIVHLLVEMINVGRIKTNLHFSNYDAILRFWSDFGITLCVSLVMFLCVEAPMMRLDQQLLRPVKKSPPAAPTVCSVNDSPPKILTTV